jgi:hypothetical protein
MKMIVVTKSDGTVVGATYVNERKVAGHMEAGLIAGPGETAHEVDVPAEFASILDGQQLHDKLKAHMSKKP